MHEPISREIEEYLTRSDRTTLPAEFTAHLMSCADCRDELAQMEGQSRMVRILKPPAEAEPGPGFYARVLERIDAQRPASIWNIFLQPFGRRLAMASLTLALLMGVYMFSTEPGTSTNASNVSGPVVMLNGEDQPGPVLGTNQEQDRGAVLVNLATYQEQ
jgi:predicted anti-sigma-YlaC factor YlaD